jgi:hypothetical protein
MRGRSGALHYSLAEFAYILFFLSVGALVLLYGEYRQSLAAVETLREEVNFLNEKLAEKENAVVPCWQRPDKTIPETVGSITIHSRTRYSILRTRDGRNEAFAAPPEERDGMVSERLLHLFAAELAYAERRNCYIRMRILNETNDFSLYKGMAEVLVRVGVVLVNE